MTLPSHPPTTTSFLSNFPAFETADLDESRQVMGQLWQKHQVECVGRVRFQTKVNHAQIGSLGLTFIDCKTPLRIEAIPTGDKHFVQFFNACSCEYRLIGQAIIGSPAQAVVCSPWREIRIRTPPARVLSLQIPSQVVAAVLEQEPGRGGDAASWHSGLDLGLRSCRSLLSAVRWAAMEVNESPELLVSLAAAHIEASLKSKFIACLVEMNLGQTGTDRPPSDSALDDIETWIHANLEQPLCVDTLAARFSTSVRSLQLAFRSRRGCSPMEFVRQARLWAVRCELRESMGRQQQVRFVAYKYGLVHLGRFAANYRELFGELPSQTVAKWGEPAPR